MSAHRFLQLLQLRLGRGRGEDQRAGRTVKFDLRVAPAEKIKWAEAASTLGLSTSEFVRDVANQAAVEVLTTDARWWWSWSA